LTLTSEGKKPKECANCHFRIAGFAEFKDWFNQAAKDYEEETAHKDDEDEDDFPLAGMFGK
jgi:hypothetical protein